jgi:hypothetical protein
MGLSRKGLIAKGLDDPARRKKYTHRGRAKSRLVGAVAALLAPRRAHP